MRICYALPYYDPAYTDPERYLERARLLRHLPQAVAGLGHEVDVVVLFPTPHTFEEGGVGYHFVPSSRPVRSLARRAGGWLGRRQAAMEPALRVLGTIRRLRPDLVHFHGTNLYLNHALLLATWGRQCPPLVLHHHGGFPSPNRLVRRVQRFNLRRVARFLFTAEAHAQPFLDAGLINRPQRIVSFIETSSPFRWQAREEARRQTGMTGTPVLLWAGRLDANKDPMTALRGFEQILPARPQARLYLYYLEDDLLPTLRQYVAARPLLQERVHFRGRVPFSQMETIFNSADLFLQASRREIAGHAILDAMACGVIPVVTDIPSFQAITDDGRYGALFPPGDAETLARGVLAVPLEDIPDQSRQVRAWFEHALSFPALARQLDTLYREVVDECV